MNRLVFRAIVMQVDFYFFQYRSVRFMQEVKNWKLTEISSTQMKQMNERMK